MIKCSIIWIVLFWSIPVLAQDICGDSVYVFHDKLDNLTIGNVQTILRNVHECRNNAEYDSDVNEIVDYLLAYHYEEITNFIRVTDTNVAVYFYHFTWKSTFNRDHYDRIKKNVSDDTPNNFVTIILKKMYKVD